MYRKFRVSRYLDEPAYYTDIIQHSLKPFKSKSHEIAEMYLKDGLSASQISDKLGISKTAILERLHNLGVRKTEERMTNPRNYRAPVVPYGYRKSGDQLVTNKKEIRICRLVVQLINEREFSLMATARELMSQKIKNRNGNIWWDHSMVRGIYQQWSEKI